MYVQNSVVCPSALYLCLCPCLCAVQSPCQLPRHFYHATQGLFHAAAHHQRVGCNVGVDIRSLVGYHPEEIPHCHQVTSVVFSDACSHSAINARHHQLCPLLMTVLSKLRNHSE